MRSTYKLALVAVVMAGALALQATPSAAQRRGGVIHRGPSTHVVIGGGFYTGPYWGYYGYDPFFWGSFGWYPYRWGYYPPPWYYSGPAVDGASLRLQVKPKDAQVYLDGFFAGIVDDFDGIFQRLHVQPGEHELVLYLKGYKSVKQSIRLQRGQDFKVQYAMVPLAAGEPNEPPPTPPPVPERRMGEPQGDEPRGDMQERPERGRAPMPDRPSAPRDLPRPILRDDRGAQGFGTLAIRVQPTGADVLVDGERWQGPDGNERLVIQLPQGSHRVEIRKDGFNTFSTEIQVRSGETVPLNVSLSGRDQ